MSLLVARLQAVGQAPAHALQEYGRLVKTRFGSATSRDETSAAPIGRQQNKGESLHAPHGRTFHGNHGTVRLHTLERQSSQAHCLHLVANAIVYWNMMYIQRALVELGDDARRAHPDAFEHVNEQSDEGRRARPVDLGLIEKCLQLLARQSGGH